MDKIRNRKNPVDGQDQKQESPVDGQDQKQESPVDGQDQKQESPVDGQDQKQESPVNGQDQNQASRIDGQDQKQESPVDGQTQKQESSVEFESQSESGFPCQNIRITIRISEIRTESEFQIKKLNIRSEYQQQSYSQILYYFRKDSNQDYKQNQRVSDFESESDS